MQLPDWSRGLNPRPLLDFANLSEPQLQPAGSGSYGRTDFCGMHWLPVQIGIAARRKKAVRSVSYSFGGDAKEARTATIETKKVSQVTSTWSRFLLAQKTAASDQKPVSPFPE